MAEPSADLLSAILDTAPDAIIRIDRDGFILDFLGQAQEMFGYDAGEIKGESITQLLPDAVALSSQGHIDPDLDAWRSGVVDFSHRFLAKRKDGSSFPVEIALSEIASEHTVSFVGVLRDVSERAAREAHIADLSERLSLASTANALGESASALAHQLNQPLTAVANYADAMDIKLQRMEGDDAKQLRALAQKAGDQARLCGEIVKRIRRTLVKQEYDPMLGDFHTAVRRSVEAVTRGFSAHDVELIIRKSGSDEAVEFDRLQLHQVIANLIRNALFALQDANVKRIVVESDINEESAELRISDTGSGVPNARKAEIFEAFVGDGLSGLGLGLAVSKRIAKAHSGRIWVEDGEDGGAIFRFVFPIKPTTT